MQLTSIEQIRDASVVGNAFGDGELWEELGRIARTKSLPLPLRAAAVRKMDELTGEDEAKGNDQTVVNDFITQLIEDTELGEL